MSKKISPVARVTAYFQTADESACATMQEVIKGIVSGRNFAKSAKPVDGAKPERKKREANKAALTSVSSEAPAPSLQPVTVANSNGNAKLNGTVGLTELMKRSLNGGGAEGAELN